MRNEPMTYSSGNHRAGKGRNTQRESKAAWVARRIKENARITWLQSADPAALTDAERREQAAVMGRKVYTERELYDMVYGKGPLPVKVTAAKDEYNQEEYDARKKRYEERARKLDEQAAELGLPTLTPQSDEPKKPEYKTVILHQHSGAWHRIATLPGGIELELEINRNAAKMLNQIPIEPLPERGAGWWTARLTEKGYNVLTYSAYAEYEAEEQQRIDAVFHSLSRYDGDRSFIAAMAGRM